MWAYFCWLQKSWVCCLILKTMPSCHGLTPMHHFTISLTAGSVEHSPLHQWKASHGRHLHFKEKTFSKSANTFNSNHMWCLFLNWWHLTIRKRTVHSNPKERQCQRMLKLPHKKAMAPHSSTLAWKIPGMEEPGKLQSMGSPRVRHDWATNLISSDLRCHQMKKRHWCDCCWRYSQTWRKSFPWSGDVHHGKPSTDEKGSVPQTQQLDGLWNAA